nr:CYTH domain-containing protein [candidate division Zixibacteria bacterium]
MMPEEKEIKIDLFCEANFRRLLEYLGSPQKRKRQVNHFFDSADNALGARGWALRIRETEDTVLVTLKGPAIREISGLTVRPEIESPFPAGQVDGILNYGLPVDILPDEIRNAVTKIIPPENLSRILTFETSRMAFSRIVIGVEICLEMDRTVYQDNSIDYELEIELPDNDTAVRVLPELTEMFAKLKVNWSFQDISKFARALKKMGTNSKR